MSASVYAAAVRKVRRVFQQTVSFIDRCVYNQTEEHPAPPAWEAADDQTEKRKPTVQFDSLTYAYPSHRNVVCSSGGMVCSTSPLGSQIGVTVLKDGGNAVDAAIAMAAAMPLLEPTGNGLGSDCFALVWTGGRLYGLNGSGTAPLALSADTVRRAGYAAVPMEGWLPVMVPGAPGAWAELRRRFGTKTMAQLMAPAIRCAREGFCPPVNVCRQWRDEVRRFAPAARAEPDVFGPWMDYFAKDGEGCRPGEVFRWPDFADTLEILAATDCESFYTGEVMEKIVAFSEKTGGYFSRADFEKYRPAWVDPISTNYRGYDVFEMPPNGHGITVLMALNILSGLRLPENRESAEAYHKTIEAVKLAFADAKKYVADPRTMRTRVSDMLSAPYAAGRRALISERALMPQAGDPSCGGTVYFCTADREGNMVSFIQSNYSGFGSGVAVPGTGITLQDRGANFSLDRQSDNCLAGGKRAYHTIIPGFLAREGKAVGPFGVMGGFMQPQGHVQVIVNTVDYHMNPQECLDAPRFQWVGGKTIQLEREVPAHVAAELAARGHQIEVMETNLHMGRGQIIWRNENGTLTGGTEPRADGTIAVW